MRIKGVIWLRNIEDKLRVKHHVATHEVEEVLDSNPKFRLLEKGDNLGEDVYMALGVTSANRYLAVIFIYKKTKEALVLSARNMDSKERKQYERK